MQSGPKKTLTLVEKEHLVDNIWAFRFRPSLPVTWVPGQFIRVEVPHNNPDKKGPKRWFTVSSAPYDEIIQITTRVTDSTFKQALAVVPVGGSIDLLETPHGDFVWEETARPIVFVAGGIGVTPFRSILRQRAHERLPLDLTLIYGSRTDMIVFKEEFERYAEQDAELKIYYVVGEPLTPAKLQELAPKFYSSLVYISGPEPLVEKLSDQLKAAGLPEDQLRLDFFPNYTEQNY